MLPYLFSALLHKDIISFSCIFHCFSTHSKDCWRDLARQTHIFVPFEIGKQYCKLAFCLFGPNCPNCPFCCCGDRGDFLHLIRRPFSKLHLRPTSNMVDVARVPELLSHANHASSSRTWATRVSKCHRDAPRLALPWSSPPGVFYLKLLTAEHFLTVTDVPQAHHEFYLDTHELHSPLATSTTLLLLIKATRAMRSVESSQYTTPSLTMPLSSWPQLFAQQEGTDCWKQWEVWHQELQWCCRAQGCKTSSSLL